MKVTLDLTRLLAEGQISQDEHDRLSRLAATDTGSLGFNILVGIGVVAVGVAALALVPTPTTGIVLGAMLMAFGLLLLARHPSWLVLANICILVAALMFGGGVLVLADGTAAAFLSIAAMFLVCAVLAQSGLLVSLGLCAVAGALGSGTGYAHATYALVIEQPTLTILIFSAIGLGAYALSTRVRYDFERLCLVAARTALFFINFGFWIGSLWGDRLTWLSTKPNPSTEETGLPDSFVPPNAFALVWAVALVGAGTWAVRANRRWTVNLVAVFGAIHFYTQWFEHLSATPLSILAAGLITLAIAIGLWKWNQFLGPPTWTARTSPPPRPGQ